MRVLTNRKIGIRELLYIPTQVDTCEGSSGNISRFFAEIGMIDKSMDCLVLPGNRWRRGVNELFFINEFRGNRWCFCATPGTPPERHSLGVAARSGLNGRQKNEAAARQVVNVRRCETAREGGGATARAAGVSPLCRQSENRLLSLVVWQGCPPLPARPRWRAGPRLPCGTA